MRIKPWIYYPQYRLGLSRGSYKIVLHGLQAFGSQLKPRIQFGIGRELDQFLRHDEFPCLGYGVGSIPHGEQWHRDAFHGHVWRANYFPRCDYLAVHVRCDVKVPWEYARMQYALWIANAYIHQPKENGDSLIRYERLILDFIAQNKVGFGVNWTCPMEVSIRGVNIALSTAILVDDLPVDVSAAIARSLADHLKFIERFPETSDVNGNHYLADLMGMVVLSRILHGSDAGRTRRALHLFVAEAERQFEIDGGHIERAPVYHRLCCEMVAVVAAITWDAASTQSTRLRTVLERGVQFCHAVGSVSRKLPVLGDNDSGHVIWFGEDARNFDSLVEFLAALSGGSTEHDQLSAKARWLIALSGAPQDIAQSAKATGLDDPLVGQRSGFVFIKNKDNELTIRVGSQGLQGRASHDHDDSQSIWLFRNGEDVIVDAGCHSYTLDEKIRAANIVSSAHNVVRPIGAERFEPISGSVFKTVRGAPTADSESLEVVGDQAVAMLALQTPDNGTFAMCTRRVSLSAQRLCVTDTWRWKQKSAAQISWRFAPGFAIETGSAESNFVLIDRCGETIGLIAFESESSMSFDIFLADFSPAYGYTEECASVAINFPTHADASLLTTLTFRQTPA